MGENTYLNTKEKRMLNNKNPNKIGLLVIVILVIIQSVGISGCIRPSNDTENLPDFDIAVGMTSDVAGFYPWMGIRDTSTLSVNRNLFTCLTEIDPTTYKYVPGLAESWNNPSNTTWRFFLRKGVQFHNGDLFTAKDVQFTIEFMRNDPFYNEELDGISEVVVVDNYTIDIITKTPCPNLLYKFATLYILSKNYTSSIQDTNETWPIGTGPYKLVEYFPGDHITLERFDHYWNELPEVKTVIFKKMNSSEELKNALIGGMLDIIPLASEYIDEIQNTTGLSIKSVQTPGVIYISFDFRVNDSFGFKGSKNPVSDVQVRKAMYHAIDIDMIIEKYLNGTATPASQFLTYHTFGYNPNITRLAYDVEIAKNLMKDAGYEEGFTIQFDIPDSPKWVNISNEIAQELSEINITMILNPLPTIEYYTNLYYKNTSLYFTSFNPIDAEGLIRILLHTPDVEQNYGAWNYGNYSNPEVDRLCEQLPSTMSMEKRNEYIQQAFFLAAADVAWIPLFSPMAFYGTGDDIKWKPRPSLFIWVDEISFKTEA